MSARRLLASAALAALLATAFVATGTGVASATPPPKRPHPVLGPAPGLRTLVVKTIPPVTGATFTFEGQPFTTGADGQASITITQQQRASLADPNTRNTALVLSSTTVDIGKDVRANFSGWYGNGSYKGGVETQTATFSFDYLTSFRFQNIKGDPVQPSLLQSMELKSSVGATIDLKSPDPVWLEGRRVTPGSGGVDVRDISYRINEVKVAGSNVVNASQQQFFPTQRTTATVKLLFFSVRFVATDAMFGGGVGKRIDLQYPDGKIRTFSLGPTHSVTVDDLPRGDYHVTVVGGGLKMARPLTVSRNQEADLDVITYLDVGLVGLALAIVAAAVLWFGLSMRRRHRATVRRRHPSTVSGPSADADALPTGAARANGKRPRPEPAPAEAATVRVGDGTGARAHDDGELEFLHPVTGDADTTVDAPSPEAVAEAFADVDAHTHAGREAVPDESEALPRDPSEVSANERFLVDGPGRRHT